jgi:hypothetical protein
MNFEFNYRTYNDSYDVYKVSINGASTMVPLSSWIIQIVMQLHNPRINMQATSVCKHATQGIVTT